jgi:DNA-binding transcriptional LysR family regulator
MIYVDNLGVMGCAMPWDERIGRRLKLRDLHLLLAVVQAGSMAKAAKRLAVSQPAVSKAIAEIEHTLGVPLLDRGPQGVEPTRYGRALIKRSMAVFDELRQGVSEIEFLRDPTTGEVRIGSGEPLAAGLVSAVIDRLSRQYPRIAFHIVRDDPVSLLRHLDDRSVELVLTRMPGPMVEEHMSAEILYDDPVVIVAGAQNPWTRRRKVELADLVNEPWVLPPHDSVLGSVVLEAFRDGGLEPPHTTVATLSLSMRNSLLATGRFLSVHPSFALKFSRNYPAIKALPIELPTTRQATGLVTLKRRALSPLADLFINCTREVVKSIVVRTHARK